MFKLGTTQNLYQQFVNSYQSASPLHSNNPYVFVDEDGIRLISSVMSEGEGSDEVVAITVVQDGLMEVLALE